MQRQLNVVSTMSNIVKKVTIASVVIANILFIIIQLNQETTFLKFIFDSLMINGVIVSCYGAFLYFRRVYFGQ